ncbi:unnamed protein product [Debaryomyces fabryi]|nr:unnamed protein product [Debaryomyces fabryi]
MAKATTSNFPVHVFVNLIASSFASPPVLKNIALSKPFGKILVNLCAKFATIGTNHSANKMV